MGREQTMRGYTLLEVLLTVTFITVIAALPFFFSRFSLSANNLTLGTQSVVHALRQAQFYAIAEKGGGPWGVKIASDDITLFRGDSFAEREEDADEITPFQNTFVITGIDEVVFQKFTGEPGITGNITLSTNSSTHTINLQVHGLLDY